MRRDTLLSSLPRDTIWSGAVLPVPMPAPAFSAAARAWSEEMTSSVARRLSDSLIYGEAQFRQSPPIYGLEIPEPITPEPYNPWVAAERHAMTRARRGRPPIAIAVEDPQPLQEEVNRLRDLIVENQAALGEQRITVTERFDEGARVSAEPAADRVSFRPSNAWTPVPTARAQTRVHLKRRNGWTQVRAEPSDFPGAPHFIMPERTESPTIGIDNTIMRIDFRLVKSAAFTDHRTHQTRKEYWYEEL